MRGAGLGLSPSGPRDARWTSWSQKRIQSDQMEWLVSPITQQRICWRTNALKIPSWNHGWRIISVLAVQPHAKQGLRWCAMIYCKMHSNRSPRGSPSGMEGQFHHFHLHFLWKGSNGVYLCKMYMMHGHGNMVHSVSKLLTPRLSSFEVPDSCVVGLMPCVVLAFHLK